MGNRRGRQIGFDRPPRHRLQRRKVLGRERLAAFKFRRHFRFADRGGCRAVVEPNRKRALYSLWPEAIAFVVEEFAPPSLSILAIGDGIR